MSRKFIAVAISAILLSTGWLGLSGLPLLVALVPLLWISAEAEDSKKGWWNTFWLALLTFVLWNVTTIWWIWRATPVGPIAATLVSSTLSMLAFMTFHTLSKRITKSLAYTFLVTGWIALEYWYTLGDVSWPWLLLGNGFSNDIWAIQWYEYTGLFGGSLWVLLANIAIFEAWRAPRRSRIITASSIALLPIIVSAVIFFTYEEESVGEIEVSVVQPNVHFERDGHPANSILMSNLTSLFADVPEGVDYIVTPECSLPRYIYLPNIDRSPIVADLRNAVSRNHPDATLVAGATTILSYVEGEQSSTARWSDVSGYYDIFNSALYIPAHSASSVHHKERLVIGTESMPMMWLFKMFDFLIIDLGGTVGELGRGTERVVASSDKATIGAAICYEALYGAYYGEFVQNGAQAMFVISNDCWWDNTPGYKHLFSMSALRAVEHRRAIARSANTGISGFISSRGDHLETLGWDERGVLTDSVPLINKMTFYTRYGDYVARVSVFLAILSLLNYMVYRVRKRHHLQ